MNVAAQLEGCLVRMLVVSLHFIRPFHHTHSPLSRRFRAMISLEAHGEALWGDCSRRWYAAFAALNPCCTKLNRKMPNVFAPDYSNTPMHEPMNLLAYAHQPTGARGNAHTYQCGIARSRCIPSHTRQVGAARVSGAQGPLIPHPARLNEVLRLGLRSYRGTEVCACASASARSPPTLLHTPRRPTREGGPPSSDGVRLATGAPAGNSTQTHP